MRQDKQMRGLRGKRKGMNEKYSDLLNNLGRGVMFKKSNKSLKNGLITIYNITYKGGVKTMSVEEYLELVKSTVVGLMSKHPNTKFSMTLIYKLIKFRLMGNTSDPEEKKGHTTTKPRILLPNDDLSSTYDEEKVRLLTSFGKEEHKGSGWMLKKILGLDIKFTNHNSLGN